MKMGRRKINHLKLIENEHQRKVTFSKRKKGIIRKAIELSHLCGLEVYMMIFDPRRQMLIQLKSNDEFDADFVQELS